MSRILIPLPDQDFDITEVVVPWRVFCDAGFDVVFATEEGATAACDPLLVTGVIFGKLGAKPENVALYRELEKDAAFQKPIRYSEIDVDFAGVVLPGGHAKGMRQYLESEVLRTRLLALWKADRPFGAICHGTIVLARLVDAEGAPVARGRRATCLPAWMELSAWALTAWKLGDYYRTYKQTVEAELREALGSDGVFERGPLSNNYARPFVVEDGNLVTARWPGDAQRFSELLLDLVSRKSTQ